MGFWIYMTVMDLLIPFTMIAFGIKFSKGAPENINSAFGYRTSMSMKNRDTWEFAHRYCGRLWRVCGAVLIPLTAAPMLLALGRGTAFVGTAGGIVCAVQLVVLVGSIFPTERALKREFDEKGERR